MATNNLPDKETKASGYSDYFDLQNVFSYEVCKINSHVAGGIALIESTEWEGDDKLCSALFILKDVHSRLQLLEEGSFIAEQKASHDPT